MTTHPIFEPSATSCPSFCGGLHRRGGHASMPTVVSLSLRAEGSDEPYAGLGSVATCQAEGGPAVIELGDVHGCVVPFTPAEAVVAGAELLTQGLALASAGEDDVRLAL